MKRIVIYIGILVLLTLTPVQGANIGRLHPVEVVLVDQIDGEVVLKTDTGDSGSGENAAHALENLKKTTAGIVYLDTAEFLLITEPALESVDQLRTLLKEKVRVCIANGEIPLEKTAQFLSVHGSLPTLKNWDGNREIAHLKYSEKKFQFFEKSP